MDKLFRKEGFTGKKLLFLNPSIINNVWISLNFEIISWKVEMRGIRFWWSVFLFDVQIHVSNANITLLWRRANYSWCWAWMDEQADDDDDEEWWRIMISRRLVLLDGFLSRRRLLLLLIKQQSLFVVLLLLGGVMWVQYY